MPSPAPTAATSRARRGAAALTVLLMLAAGVPAVVLPLRHHALLGLFSPDLGAGVAFAVVGAFLLVRGSVRSVAAIMCVQGVTASLTALSGVLNTLAIAAGPLRGATLWVEWASGLVWLPGVVLLVPLVLVFPDGRLAARRWRWPIRVNATLAICYIAEGVLRKGALVDDKPESFAANPTGVIRFDSAAGHALDVFNGAIVLGFMATLLISLGAVVGRRRRAEGVQRAQLTSLLYGGTVTVVMVGSLTVVPTGSLTANGVAFAIGLVAVAPVALSIGLAVLRYRLYEIDRIVSRTVTYVLVLGVLIAVYAVVVTGLVAVVPHLGQLGVAAATLAVSALAVPLTRRVRRVIDRRFNRRRYDAERLVSGFAERLRRPGLDSTVDSIADGLVAVAARAVEPRHASVWLARSGVGA